MARLPKLLSRRPPRITPPEPDGEPERPFDIALSSEPTGWTVTAYGADGRRLGRPLKGLSDPAQATLAATLDRIQDDGERERLATAWVQACRAGVTNGEVLTGFADAAARLAAEREAG